MSPCLDFDNKLIFRQILENPDLVHADLPFHTWSETVRAQIIALEVLTNLFALDEDTRPDNVALPQKLVQMVVESGICQKILPLCKFVDPTILALNKLEFLQDLFPNFDVVQATGLSCLNNILIGMPIEVLGDPQHLYNGLFQWCGQAFSSGWVSTDEIKSLTISCLCSLIRRTNFTPEGWQVEAAFKLASYPLEQVRTHALGMLGCFAKSSIGPQISLELGNLLLKSLSDPSGWVISEAMDTIFAVFDDRFEDVVVKLNMLQKVKEFGVFLASKINELAVIEDSLLHSKLDEILTNIDPFLEYKRQQSRKNKS